MEDFYDDFRRAHIDTLIKYIISNDYDHDIEPADERPFSERYSEKRKELQQNLAKFLNVSDTQDCFLLVEQRKEMFYDIFSNSIDDMFCLFFESGLQSGIIFALDLDFLGKSDLFNKVVRDKLEKDISIFRDLMNE